MREKDHSPRKMLPSPKQGAVYPLLGVNFPHSGPKPFDLSVQNRSSSSNLLHQEQNALEQPLDLRVDRKRSTTLTQIEDENSNIISIKKEEFKWERSESPLHLNNSNLKSSNNNYLSIKEELRIPGLSAHSQALLPPPSLHPLMLGKCFHSRLTFIF